MRAYEWEEGLESTCHKVWNSVVLAALNAMRGYDDPYCVVGFQPVKGEPAPRTGTSRVELLKQARVWHGSDRERLFLRGLGGMVSQGRDHGLRVELHLYVSGSSRS